MSDLCRFDHLMFDPSSDPHPNEGIDDALRVLARIIARHLSGEDAHKIIDQDAGSTKGGKRVFTEYPST